MAMNERVAKLLRQLQEEGLRFTLYPDEVRVDIGLLELTAVPHADQRIHGGHHVRVKIGGVESASWLKSIDLRVAVNEVVTAEIVLGAIL